MDEKLFDPLDPLGMFNATTAERIQRELLTAVCAIYGISYGDCEQFEASTLADILPHWRRAKIEEALAELGGRLDGCSVKNEKNEAGTCSHNVLLIGDRIVLTQSKVDDRYRLPRDAAFRGTYARSPQMLFDFMNGEIPPNPDSHQALYAIMTHSPSDVAHLPLFVDIVFPDPTCKYILGRVRLMEKFPDVVQHFVPAEEVILPEVDQKLRLKRPLADESTS